MKIKNWVSLVLIFTLLISIFTPTIVNADINMTGKYLKFTETATDTEEIDSSIDIAEYINGKKTPLAIELSSHGLSTPNGSDVDYNTLFSTTEGNYKYITITNISEPDTTAQANHLVDGVLCYDYNISYKTVTVTQAAAQSAQKINSINVNVASPTIGTTISETTAPNVTVDGNANYTVGFTVYINNYPSVDESYDSGAIFGTTIEEGKDYYLEVYLATKEGYEFDTANNVALKVNGGTDFELGYCSEHQYSFFTKVKATSATPEASESTGNPETVATSETPVAESPTVESPVANGPVYEYIYGQDQIFNTASGVGLSFRIDADYSLFENGGKVYIDDNEVDPSNYTSKSGSTIISFTDEYAKTLSMGEHILKIAFNNGGTATTKFTVTSVAPGSAQASAVPAVAVVRTSSNPVTGDNLVFSIILMIVSALGIAGTVLVIKKKHI